MYELHTLGWNSFQQLCLTIAREILGQTTESFLDSNDGGRDGAFAGTWNAAGGENMTGSFVIQCKFTSRRNYSLQIGDLTDEARKAERLAASGRCDIYILMTNASVSGRRAEEILELFRGAGAKHVVTLGSTWLTQQIRDNKRLRMLVPRVYGLGDLSQILDERAYLQARAVVESMRDDLAKVVFTEAYQRAAAALDQHGFVLLIGEPASGKTTIASMLAMIALDQWQSSLLKIDEPSQIADRWNPEEPSQFFWLDDAFGVTQYEEFLVNRWNRVLPRLNPILRGGAKVVMTSRDYIYNRARKDLKESAFPLLNESQVVIDLHELSEQERRQILYNHLKLGKQPRDFLSSVKPFLEEFADHARFIPEMARRLSDPVFTKGLHVDAYHLRDFVDRREQLLREVLEGLDSNSKAALALVYMRNDRLASPIELQTAEADALDRLGSDLGGCISALEAMKGSLVVRTSASGNSVWRFKHPTISDAYADLLVESPELIGIYLQGSSSERLIEQVTCGDVGLEKALVIPPSHFPTMINKLNELSQTRAFKNKHLSSWSSRRSLFGFLATRCSKAFMETYLRAHPDLLAEICKPRLMLSSSAEVRLVSQIHALGLLPELNRLTFVETVSNFAIQGIDTGAIDDPLIMSVFSQSEHEKLIDNVRTQLLPNLSYVRQEYQSNIGYGESREDHMYFLIASLHTLRRCFSQDLDALDIVETELRNAEEWVSEDDGEKPEPAPRVLGDFHHASGSNSTRSMFEDIDASDESPTT